MGSDRRKELFDAAEEHADQLSRYGDFLDRPLRKIVVEAFLAGVAHAASNPDEPQLAFEAAATGASLSPVAKVWEAHLVARSAYYRKKNGRPPTHTPRLTPELRKLISQAIRRHGYEQARAAGIGLFLSPFHTGREAGAKGEFLSPDVAWRLKPGTLQDNVERFAALYFAKRDSLEAALASESSRRDMNLLDVSTQEEGT